MARRRIRDIAAEITQEQERVREIGRIRFGEKRVSAKSGKEYPAALDTPRLTSPSEEVIRAVGALYGGEPREWESPAGPQWEVTITHPLAIAVPQALEQAWSRAYELWSAGGCQRRCDGVTVQVPQGKRIVERPCVCGTGIDPEDRECALHLRFLVMVLGIPVLGLWRAETHGWYAGQEIPVTLDLLRASGRTGFLRLERRRVVRHGETRNFPVVVIDAPFMPEELLGIERPPGMEALAPPPVRQLGHGAPDAREALPRERYAELKAKLPPGVSARDFFEGHGITRASTLADDAVYDRACEALDVLRAGAGDPGPAAAAAPGAVDDQDTDLDDEGAIDGEVEPDGPQETSLFDGSSSAYGHPEAP